MEFHAAAHPLNLLQLGQRICFTHEIFTQQTEIVGKLYFYSRQAGNYQKSI